MFTIEINNIQFLVSSKISVLEACRSVGIFVLRFCYHETLSVAGNCRMCLVELQNSPKPIASCALPVLNNMKIYTDTPLVKKARENILESLLLNHPLDCPICDQGGDCDLQDQSKLAGNLNSRDFFKKRGVEDKEFNFFIKTIMTRCIHCTRCVRFNLENSGDDVLGTLQRGAATEIGNYSSNTFNSEISGNVIDLCPVGALTSKFYTFKARPWELKICESVDLTDSSGSNIYLHYKDNQIIRVLPKINTNINGNVISDKARFSYDYLSSFRLKKVLVKESNHFCSSTFAEFLDFFGPSLLIEKKRITVLINEDLNLNSILLLKALSYEHKNIKVASLNSRTLLSNFYQSTLIDSFTKIKQDSKMCFILASNLKIESAILNSKLRLKQNSSPIQCIGSGAYTKSNLALRFINVNVLMLLKIFEGKTIGISQLLLIYKNPICCFGSVLNLRGLHSFSFSAYLKKLIPTIIFINISLFSNSHSFELFQLKYASRSQLLKSDFLIPLHLDDNLNLYKYIDQFIGKIFWVSSHGSVLANRADYLIPVFDTLEDNGYFVNAEGRIQPVYALFSGATTARSVNAFFHLFLKNKPKQLFFNFLFEIVKNPPLFQLAAAAISFQQLLCFSGFFNKLSRYPIKGLVEDFYCSNRNTRLSLTMTRSTKKNQKFYGNFQKNHRKFFSSNLWCR